MDKCKVGVVSQEPLKIDVNLVLSAKIKSYMPRGLTQQRMTLNDLALSSSSSSMNFYCAYYGLNIGALHESDKTLKTEGLKSLNIKSSSKK